MCFFNSDSLNKTASPTPSGCFGIKSNMPTMKNSPTFSQTWQYLLSGVLIALTTLLFYALRDFLDTTLVALLYLIPIGVITTFAGFAPGIASALFSFFAFNYFLPKDFPLKTRAPFRRIPFVIG
jgi:K+-sensing histidine kinase KdpD